MALAKTRNTTSGAEAMLLMAQRVSRRDAGTQILLLQMAAARNDYRAGLAHLDNVLTINQRLGEQINPLLAPLLADGEFREALLQFSRRPWFFSLLSVAAGTLDNPADLATVLLESRVSFAKAPPGLLSIILDRLVKAGHFDLASRVARENGNAEPGILKDFGFSQATTNQTFAPLTWLLFSNDVVQTQFHKDRGVESEIQPGQFANIAERVTNLAAGDYVLEQQFGELEGASGLQAEWRMACITNEEATPVWRDPIPIGTGMQRNRLMLRIPNDCPVQRWQIWVRGVDGQSSTRFRLTGIKLHRVA